MSFGAEHHIALPALVGAPAYSRPPRPIDPTPRPIDPDDLPIEALMTAEEKQLLAAGGVSSISMGYASDAAASRGGSEPAIFAPQARYLTLRSVASRIEPGR